MSKPSPPPPPPKQLQPVELKLYPSRSPAFTDTVPLPPPTNPPTWAQIQKVICSGNLDDLYRDPACEKAYRAWSGPVKQEWGSLERFIRVVRLEWDDPVLAAVKQPNGTTKPTPTTTTTTSSSSSSKNGFFEDIEDEWEVKMIPNHWPYNMPPGCKHWCVWSRKPITHISQLPASTAPNSTSQSSSSSATAGPSHLASTQPSANGHVAPASPPVLPSDPNGDSSHLARADHSQLSSIAPVPWPFPHMTRAEQEDLYNAVSHDGIRALVPSQSFTEHDLTPAPVTGEHVLEFFRKNPHLAAPDRILLPNNQNARPETIIPGGQDVVVEAPLEAHAIAAANATMAYFSQHCVQSVLRRFPPGQGWDSILFLNPPNLRTVPGLDHWHIMSLDPAVQAQSLVGQRV